MPKIQEKPQNFSMNYLHLSLFGSPFVECLDPDPLTSLNSDPEHFSSVAHPDPDPYVLALPDPDPLVRRPDTDPSIIKQNLNSYCYVTSL